MELFERVQIALDSMTISQREFAKRIGVPQRTLCGYMNARRQDHLLPLLPAMLKEFPRLSRQWLYFGEGPAFIGQRVPLHEDVPQEDVREAVQKMAQDASGQNKDILRYIAGLPPCAGPRPQTVLPTLTAAQPMQDLAHAHAQLVQCHARMSEELLTLAQERRELTKRVAELEQALQRLGQTENIALSVRTHRAASGTDHPLTAHGGRND